MKKKTLLYGIMGCLLCVICGSIMTTNFQNNISIAKGDNDYSLSLNVDNRPASLDSSGGTYKINDYINIKYSQGAGTYSKGHIKLQNDTTLERVENTNNITSITVDFSIKEGDGGLKLYYGEDSELGNECQLTSGTAVQVFGNYFRIKASHNTDGKSVFIDSITIKFGCIEAYSLKKLADTATVKETQIGEESFDIETTDGNTHNDFAFASSDDTIASIDTNNKVAPNALGMANISLLNGGKTTKRVVAVGDENYIYNEITKGSKSDSTSKTDKFCYVDANTSGTIDVSEGKAPSITNGILTINISKSDGTTRNSPYLRLTPKAVGKYKVICYIYTTNNNVIIDANGSTKVIRPLNDGLNVIDFGTYERVSSQTDLRPLNFQLGNPGQFKIIFKLTLVTD